MKPEDTIEKLFVTYEIAKLLKEHGFKYPCIRFYEKNKNGLEKGIVSEYWGDYTDFYDWNNGNKPYKPFCECYSAPMYQQVIDWFKNEHGIQLFPDYFYYDGFYYGYKWVKSNGSYGSFWKDNNGSTPEGTSIIEEATIIAIKEALKLTSK